MSFNDEPYTVIDLIKMEKNESSIEITENETTNNIIESSIINAIDKVNNQTFCESVDKEYDEVIISFSYSLETTSTISNELENRTNEYQYLVSIVENTLHDFMVLELLQDCLSFRLLQGTNSSELIEERKEDKLKGIASSPSDMIKMNKKCQEKDRLNLDNDCFVVKSTFSIFLDNLNKSKKQVQLDVLDKIQHGMEMEILTQKANNQLSTGLDNIAKLTFLDDNSIWEIILGLLISLLALILLLVCVMKKRKRKQSQSLQDLDSKQNIAHVLDDDESYDFAQKYGKQSTPRTMELDNQSMTSSDSISSYTGDAKHTLDVHICTSAYCLTCRKLGKPPTFLCVDVPNTPSIELTSNLPQDWWKKE